MKAELTGNYRVRAFQSAFDDVRRLCAKIKDRMEFRRHALKLRYWPNKNPEDEKGQLIDLDWEWVKAAHGLKIGELRIHDTINDHDNLRLIFFVGDSKVTEPLPKQARKDQKPLPMIWVLNVLQKKRDHFTKNNIKIFKARRKLVLERFYENADQFE